MNYRFRLLFILLFPTLTGIATNADQTPEVVDNDKDTLCIIGKITIADKLMTISEVIIKELTFKQEDILTTAALKQEIDHSVRNLNNTSLFLTHRTMIEWGFYDSVHIEITIHLKERWHFWPEPILENAERNFNTWWLDKDLEKLNYGIHFIKDNFKGRAQRITLVLQTGYDQKYGITFTSPPKKTIGFGFGASYKANREVAYQIKDDQPVYLRTEQQSLTQKNLFIQLLYRPAIYHHHRLSLEFNQFKIGDTLLKLNPQFAGSITNEKILPRLSYQFKVDHRNHRAYPLDGYYFDIEWANSSLNGFSFSTPWLMSLKGNFRKYFRLDEHLFYALGFTGKTSSHKDQPFLLERGLGYGREYVRGYEYNVVHGQHFILLKHNIKHTLVSPTSFFISFLPIKKFKDAWLAVYLNAFMDAGYVYSNGAEPNQLPGRWIGGAGLGIDFVAYYDKVIRFEMTVNDLHRTGFYLHFIAPI